jgi:hypothetical protein
LSVILIRVAIHSLLIIHGYSDPDARLPPAMNPPIATSSHLKRLVFGKRICPRRKVFFSKRNLPHSRFEIVHGNGDDVQVEGMSRPLRLPRSPLRAQLPPSQLRSTSSGPYPGPQGARMIEHAYHSRSNRVDPPFVQIRFGGLCISRRRAPSPRGLWL